MQAISQTTLRTGTGDVRIKKFCTCSRIRLFQYNGISTALKREKNGATSMWLVLLHDT